MNWDPWNRKKQQSSEAQNGYTNILITIAMSLAAVDLLLWATTMNVPNPMSNTLSSVKNPLPNQIGHHHLTRKASVPSANLQPARNVEHQGAAAAPRASR